MHETEASDRTAPGREARRGTVDVPEAPGSPATGATRVAAIFDLDRTLIAGYSAIAFGRDLLRSGHVDLWTLQPELSNLFERGWGAAAADDGRRRVEDVGTYDKLMSVLGGLLAGVRRTELDALGERLFESDYRARLHPEAFECVERHRALGHRLVIASAATEFQAMPIARAFGIDDVLCTRFETFRGRLTGALERACWGEGKRLAAATFAHAQGLRLEDSYFYSDGLEDVPLLEAVGHPRPTNPDERLAKIAQARDWPVAHFDRTAPPSVWELARPLAEPRPPRDWRTRVEKALDDQVRMGYRSVHWLRRSIRTTSEHRRRRNPEH